MTHCVIIALLLLADGAIPTQVVTPPGRKAPQSIQIQGSADGTPIPTSGTPAQGSAGTNGQAWWVRVGDTTNGPVAVKAPSTGAVAADPSFVIQISPNQSALVIPLGVNLSQVGGTATVNGGLAGSQAVGGTAASNAAINQNPVLIAGEALSTQPAAATTGNQRRLVTSLDGALYARPYGPIIWTCVVSAQTVKKSCQAAPGAGLKLYVTDVWWTNNSATATSALLASGTGADCVTTTNNKTAAHTVPVSGAGSNVWLGGMTTPVAMNANEILCTVPGGANSYSATISGFTAP